MGPAQSEESAMPSATAAANTTAAEPVRVRVWDLPLRVFHWLLVACLIGSFVTIKQGKMDLHFWFGYTALSLLIFRLIWGFVGPRYARFSSFLFSPISLFRHVAGRRDAPRTLGHSPAGALSVFALLTVLAAQAISGLFVSDQIATEGPLARHVSTATVDTASWLHYVNEQIILGLVGLHLAAIVLYRVVKKERLTRAMLIGDKQVSAQEALAGGEPARDDAGMRIRAGVVAVVSVGLVALIVNWPA